MDTPAQKEVQSDIIIPSTVPAAPQPTFGETLAAYKKSLSEQALTDAEINYLLANWIFEKSEYHTNRDAKTQMINYFTRAYIKKHLAAREMLLDILSNATDTDFVINTHAVAMIIPEIKIEEVTLFLEFVNDILQENSKKIQDLPRDWDWFICFCGILFNFVKLAASGGKFALAENLLKNFFTILHPECTTDFPTQIKAPHIVNLNPLGNGNFGKVYPVKIGEETLAMKYFVLTNGQGVQNNEGTMREMGKILIELFTLIRLRNKNFIISIAKFSVVPRPAIFMECASHDLFTLVNAGDILPHKQQINYALQIALGLLAMHAAGILHRDIKPENILLVNGFIKIGDMGTAISKKTLEAMPENKRFFEGTPIFSAPNILVMRQHTDTMKQIKTGYASRMNSTAETTNYSEASDIYSFGLTLLMLMLKQSPYNDFPLCQDLAHKSHETIAFYIAQEGHPPVDENFFLSTAQPLVADLPLTYRKTMLAMWDHKISNRPHLEHTIIPMLKECVNTFDCDGPTNINCDSSQPMQSSL